MGAQRRLFARGTAVLAIWAIAATGLIAAPHAASAATTEPPSSATHEQTVVVGEDGSMVMTTDAVSREAEQSDPNHAAAPVKPGDDVDAPGGSGDDARADSSPPDVETPAPLAPSTSTRTADERPGASDDAPTRAGPELGGDIADLRANARAADSGDARISGTVTDAEGAPLEGIEATLTQRFGDDGWAWVTSTATDAGGRYVFADIAAGEYSVRFDDPTDAFVTRWLGSGDGDEGWFDVGSSAQSDGHDVALSRGAEISGSVAGPDGRPVGGAWINVYRWNAAWSQWAHAAAAGVDESGSFRFAGLEAGEYTLFVEDTELTGAVSEWWDDAVDEKDASRISLSPGQVVADVRIDLVAGGSLSGRVTDDTGAAVSAWVTVHRRTDDGWTSVRSVETVDGAYRVSGLAAGDYTMSVDPAQKEHPRLISEWWQDAASSAEATEISLSTGEERSGLDVDLRTGARISGTVSSSAGPVADAYVRLLKRVDNDGDTWWDEVDYAVADQTGAFTFDRVRSGTYTISYRAPEGVNLQAEWWKDAPTIGAATSISVIEGTTRTGFDAVLATGGKVQGRVVDAAGRPLEASVTLYRVEQHDGWTSRYDAAGTDTGPDGAFAFVGLAPGDYTIRTYDPTDRYAAEWWDDEPFEWDAASFPLAAGATKSGLTVALAPAAEIGGVVTDAAGRPLVEAPVALYAGRDDFRDVAWAQTDASGRWRASGLAAGAYTARASGPEGSNVLRQWFGGTATAAEADLIALAAGQKRTDVDFALQPGGSIEGTVLDAAGQPVVDAQVTVYEWRDGSRTSVAWHSTDERGVYTARELPAGRYVVRFSGPDDRDMLSEWWDDARTDEDAKRIDLGSGQAVSGVDATLAEGARLSGTVTDDAGNPVADAQVEVRTTIDGGTWSWGENTRSDGTWSIGSLEPGVYAVRFSSPDGRNLMSEWWRDASTEAAADKITLTAGQKREAIDASLSVGASISGRVVDAKGAPVAELNVAFARIDGDRTEWMGSVFTGPDGRYTFGGLRAGTYIVEFFPSREHNLLGEWWRDATDERTATRISVRDRAEVRGIDATLAIGSILSGRVVGPDGRGVGDVAVRAQEEGTGRSSYADSADDGSWSIRGLRAGTYRIQFTPEPASDLAPEWWKDARNESGATPVSVAAGASATRLDARLDKGGSLAGIVRDPRGAPVEGVRIDVFEGSGILQRLVTRTETAADGTYRARGLADGAYSLKFIPLDSSGLATAWWKGQPSRATATTVTVQRANDVKGLDTALPRGAEISGSIVDDAGRVPSYAGAVALQRVGSAWEAAGFADVDDDGRFTVRGLPAGRYTVRFNRYDGVDTGSMWWRDAKSEAVATSFEVTAGQQLTGFDARIARPTTAANPTISGTPRVGATLTASTGAWQSGATLSYRWYRNDEPIPGATGRTLTLTAEHAGATMGVEVSGWTPATSTVHRIEWMQERVALGILTAPVPRVTGTVTVGSKLSITAGTWTKGAKLTYQWSVGGAAVKDATAATFTVPASAVGKKITVTVSGALAGYQSASKKSAETVSVPLRVLAAGTPKITGSARIGSTLTAAPGTWTKGAALSYQWLVGGVAVKGATKSTFTVPASAADKAIAVRVTGALSGYATASKTSASTAKVLKTAKPTISGTAKVGRTLTAKPGLWTSKTAFSFQWYANGKAISKATKSTLAVSASLRGKKITVTVTGKKSGYTSVSLTSGATKAVVR